jgi:hypothetical protein
VKLSWYHIPLDFYYTGKWRPPGEVMIVRANYLLRRMEYLVNGPEGAEIPTETVSPSQSHDTGQYIATGA